MGCWWGGWLCAWLCLGAAAAQEPRTVLELSERFLEVKDSGQWLVQFYAPWCGHCKRLAPVWEQVGEALAEQAPGLRVARLDATRFPSVASAFSVHGFPSIKFLRDGQVLSYDGDRTKRALVAFARKASGPAVRAIYPEPKYFLQEYLQHYAENFFVLVEGSGEGSSSGQSLREAFRAAADARLTRSWFFSAERGGLPANVSAAVEGAGPAVLALSAEGVRQFAAAPPDLLSWVDRNRHPLFPELTYGNLADLGECCSRSLVIVVSELVERGRKGSASQRMESRVQDVFRAERRLGRSRIAEKLQACWTDGTELASQVVLGSVELGTVLVLDVETQLFALAPSQLSDEELRHWLLQAAEGELGMEGGRGFLRRLRRLVWELYTTVWAMFATQPLLSVCLFGLPAGILSIICYTLCSVDMSEQTEDLYKDDDDDADDTDDQHSDLHPKRD